jgi:hypothetical protein
LRRIGGIVAVIEELVRYINRVAGNGPRVGANGLQVPLPVGVPYIEQVVEFFYDIYARGEQREKE